MATHLWKKSPQTLFRAEFLESMCHVLESRQSLSHSVNTGVSGKHGFHSSKFSPWPWLEQQGFEKTSSYMPSSRSQTYKRSTGLQTQPPTLLQHRIIASLTVKMKTNCMRLIKFLRGSAVWSWWELMAQIVLLIFMKLGEMPTISRKIPCNDTQCHE